jgi:protein-arginine kinase activator protein McsA
LVCACEQCGRNKAEYAFGYDGFDHARGETVRFESLICGNCLTENETKFKQEKRAFYLMWIETPEPKPEPKPFIFR